MLTDTGYEIKELEKGFNLFKNEKMVGWFPDMQSLENYIQVVESKTEIKRMGTDKSFIGSRIKF